MTVPQRIRILFLYNVPDWAIHNVGRSWAALLRDTHDFTLMRFGEHEREHPARYDFVVWGYSTLRHSGRMLLASLTRRPLGWLRWERSQAPNLCAVVQDPSELFPERPDWKTLPPRVAHLRRFARLAVTSNEMQAVVTATGRDVYKVNTASLLPVRVPEAITPEPLRVFTRAIDYPRKNLPLFHALQRRFAGRVEAFDARVGASVGSTDGYVRAIDGFNCYVCTSWQEGGPLPLMDAQQRGCVVLTTRVGQTDERVVDGVNGFFCDDEESFARRLEQLQNDPEMLLRMRHAALRMAAERDDARIAAQLREFLPAR